MEDFIWRLAVAVGPFCILIGSTTFIFAICEHTKRHRLAWKRSHRVPRMAHRHHSALVTRR